VARYVRRICGFVAIRLPTQPFNVIALWLGHESTNTTHRYVEANLEMKEKALGRLEVPDIKLKRFPKPRFPLTSPRFLDSF
jgi:hypothetical protein